ncbi:MAG TPA: T9SS type A sorting domain-containing protein [Ignavibacteriaceae bacterium]|nr:T9SS type A sorting domain-containing protein [Ignavibacteriaceae bacterium]
MMKLSVIFTLLFAVNLSSQISDVTRFPHQNKEQQYFESSPVVISEDELMLFYLNPIGPDTLYYSRTKDAGLTWSNPQVITGLGWRASNSPRFLTSLKTSTGRIILAWTDYTQGRIVTIHSDDNALSWSDRISFGTSARYNLVLSELEDGKIWLSSSYHLGTFVGIRESTDNGETWTLLSNIFPTFSNNIKTISFVSMPYKILAFFEQNESGIYYKESTSGYFGSVSIPVIDSPLRENNPRVIKYSDTHLKILYQVVDTSEPYNPKNDIYYIESFNGGINWGSPQRFTSYAGEDQYVQAAKSGDKAFITFSSTRYTNQPQISYAIIGETVEQFRPPFIEGVFANADSLSGKHWLISSNVIDDEEVVKVTVTFEDGSYAELFDDGLHNDGGANDNLFANVVLLNSLEPSKAGKIDVNKLTLPFNNKGIIADTRTSFSQSCIFEATDNSAHKCQFVTVVEEASGIGAGGRFEEGGFLFSGGFVMSGYTNETLWANAQASAMLVEDYIPGSVGSDKNDPLNKIYTIYRDDPPFGYSWQRWKDAVSLGAEFYDGDGDGIYSPVDKNWNGTWDPDEDMPMLIGDQTAWCVYNDGLPKGQRRWNTVNPQGIEVRQTIFATDNPELENVIFIRYSILNTGLVAEIMDSVYFGVWEDADVGDYTKDKVGCDTLLNSGFYYKDGPDAIYGINPPSFFTTFLQGPFIETNNPSDTAHNNSGELIGSEKSGGRKNLDITSHVFSVPGPSGFMSPENEVEAKNYMLGKNRVGQFPDPCNFIYGEVRGGVNCNEINPAFWVSGDPVSDYGWINTFRSDKRNLISTGPFLLEKDKPQEIIIAYVIGRGTDPLSSVTVARENVQRAIQEYQSNFASMTYMPPSATNPVNSYVLYQNYPNPFNPTTTIRYELPQDGVVTIEVFDILGQKVKTILNEFKRADRYEVTFSSTGLASGVYIYQLRVNDFITSKKMILIR